MRKQPGDMSCLPPLALRPLIWSLSALAAVGDQHGTWLTNGHASVKLRPVNPRHGRIAQLVVWPTTVALYAICIATALALKLSPWVVLALMIGVVIPPLAGIYTIHDSNRRAASFATPLDMISAELVRHHRAPRGAGAALRDDIHSFANANQRIIGGVAASNRLRDHFYLPAGRRLDCGHPPTDCSEATQCRRTVFDPKPRSPTPADTVTTTWSAHSHRNRRSIGRVQQELRPNQAPAARNPGRCRIFHAGRQITVSAR